jgi:hypothetical protein
MKYEVLTRLKTGETEFAEPGDQVELSKGEASELLACGAIRKPGTPDAPSDPPVGA